MIIDILSDLHLDFYFSKKPRAEAIQSIYGHIFTDNEKREVGDVLVIAGDIGHYNNQNIRVLRLIKEVFAYKHIICVLGNHDYYLIDSSSRHNFRDESLNRVRRMRGLINKEENMYCLNGNIVEIDGVRFGGCDSWYDGLYTQRHFGEKCPMWNIPKDNYYMDQLWENSMYDSSVIYNFNWREYASLEKKKIENIHKDVDIMITHVNPSIEKEHTSVSYREHEGTGFFTFDGSKYMKNGSMKYWIFGHTHVDTEYEMHGVRCIANQMGYPAESGNGEWVWIKSIEI